jgi:hypothetical protein
MRTFRPLIVATLLGFLGQGCASTGQKTGNNKKRKMPPKVTESYALMDDFEKVDLEILRRGNKARGLSEY